ncbi:MAG TPA: serine/threonine-protein kinase [Kofleriaceae bacterium]
MSKAAAEVGSTANSYQILGKLASGGMAEIFLARGESVAGVGRYCVLKRVIRERAKDTQFVRMFLDEARLASQLQHPNIAAVYDIGKLGDSYFFTMEYVHGETVRALIHRAHGLRRPIPLAVALSIAAGAAAGLHHAHERNGPAGKPLGIVHRDVSPSNLMVSFEGNVKLVDFGVAKAADRATETRSGTVKGKISYLSPEQCKGGDIDRRSDLYSLGIVLWELLAVDRLYKRQSDFENMSAIVNEAPPLPSSRRDDIPPEIDAIVMRLLAKDPRERFQTAEEVVESIENASARAGVMLSAGAVARFVRDLFGTRPEPWMDSELRSAQQEPVTVTSQPVPRELGLAQTDIVEGALASVVELGPSALLDLKSIDEAADERAHTTPGSNRARPTAPARVKLPGVADASDAGPAPLGPTPPAGEVPEPIADEREAEAEARPAETQELSISDLVPPSRSLERGSPLPLAAPPETTPSGASLPKPASVEPAPKPELAPPRKQRIGVILGVGIVALGAAAAIYVLSRPDESPTKQPVALPALDAPLPDAPPPPPDASAIVVTPIPADAAEAPPPPDAPQLGALTHELEHPHPPPPPRPPAPTAKLDAELRANDWAGVADECEAPPIFALRKASCVIAACHVHRKQARALFAQLAEHSADATLAIEGCKSAHLDLTVDCKADPMRCQNP